MSNKISNIIKDFVMLIPNLKVIQIINYDDNNYLICAVKDINNVDNALDPYYIMDKNGNNAYPFAVSKNYDNFFKACRERELWNRFK